MIKPKIFLNVGTYLPGYRGGGPTQSIKNLTNVLSNQFDFYIFTVNHDFGVIDPYATVKTDEWNHCYGVKIFYSSDKNKIQNLQRILKSEHFSLIFLNSFFNLDTIKIISIYHRIKLKTPVVLMPRGELSEGALNIKKNKKKLYIRIVKSINFLNGIHYIATAEDEFNQIKKTLDTYDVSLLSNIPNVEKALVLDTKESNKLKVVFLSRITGKKNLDYALKTLQKCQNNIDFDIYGTIEDKKYWAECKKIIEYLPTNISVSYKGELINEKVVKTLANYDLFYFPTKSENYGHVISEAFQASLPALISSTTPWLELEGKNHGWVYDLSDSASFTQKIDDLAEIQRVDYNYIKNHIYETFDVQTTVGKVAIEYKKILTEIIMHEKI